MKREKNKSTKRIMLVTSLALCMGMLTGCSFGKPTTESLLKEYEKTMKDVQTADVDVDFNCSFDVSKEDVSLSMELTGGSDMKYVKEEEDDFKAYTNTDFKVTLLGISQKTQTESYIIGENGTVTSYSKSEDEDEWSKKEDYDFTLFSGDSDMTSLSEVLTLQEETVVEDQTECYVLTGTVTGKDAQGLESLGMDLDLDDLEMNLALKMSKDNKKPVSITYTIGEESFSKLLQELLGEEMEDAKVDINDFEIVLRFDSINEDLTIEVPDEVFDAKESEDSGLLDDWTSDGDEDEFSYDLDDDDTRYSDDDDSYTDSDDEEGFYGLDEDGISPSEFEARGYDCKEYIQKDEYRTYDYLRVLNNNKESRSVSVYATFLKDGKKVGSDMAFLNLEPETFLIADLSCDEEFDAVDYSFEESEYYGSELIGTDMDVFYDIQKNEGMITGNVTNDSDKAASYPKIHVILLNGDGEVIEHQYAYAESDVLWPGESSDYSIYFDHTEFEDYIIYAEAEASEE